MYIFEIFGIPQAQKQTRFTTINGKPRTYDPSRKQKEFLQWQIRPHAPEVLIAQPVELTIHFYMPIPKSISALKKRQMLNHVLLPDVRPDEDNLAYIVTNALKGIVYDDDKRVCAKHVFKLYGAEPKTVIKVRPILQMEQVGLHETDI